MNQAFKTKKKRFLIDKNPELKFKLMFLKRQCNFESFNLKLFTFKNSKLKNSHFRYKKWTQ